MTLLESGPLGAVGPADLRAIADLVPALISFYGLDHICRFANEAHREWCHAEPAGYRGLHMRDCIGHDLYTSHAPYLSLVASGEPVSFEAVVPHRDGGTCLATINYHPKYGPSGLEGFFIVVIFPDDARRAHEELLKSEYRYRNMFQAMAVAFWECDFTGVGEKLRDWRAAGINDLRRHFAEHPESIRELTRLTRAIDVNTKAVQLFRAKRKADLIGPIDHFWPAASEHVFAQSVLAAVGRVPYFQTETRLLALDREEMDVLFTVSFSPEVVDRGTILIGIIDVSERNRALNELHHLQSELAHAARVSTLGELTASIAHEVNQPLAAIVTNGEASLRWLRRDTPDIGEIESAIARMISDGKRASEIITRIRAMSIKTEAEREQVDIRAIIEDAASLLRREFAAHDAALRIDCDDDAPLILADRIQMHQVIVNLLMNSLQAIARSEIREVTVSAARGEDGSLTVSVRDTGCGIAEADLARLFQAFFTTRAAGMGMGLSICRSIIEAHSGRIWAERDQPYGSVFSFSLPAAPPE